MRPLLISIYIWITIVLLGMLCLIVPEGGWTIGKWNLRWPTLEEVLNGKPASEEQIDDSWNHILDEFDHPNDSVSSADSITTASGKKFVIDPNNHDSRYYLISFYQALDSANIMPVRVVHYGDSQIEEDRITSIIRELWQTRYGGGGVGLIPLHQTIPTATIRQSTSINNDIQSTQGGPKRYLTYGPSSMRLDNNDYGVMGQVAFMDDNLVSGSQHISMSISPYSNPKIYNYFNRIRIIADGINTSITSPQSTTKTYAKNSTIFHLPNQVTSCDIEFNGQGKVYGISLETPTGVIVDNIPMRGCSGTVFTNIDKDALTAFYRETNTRLIILQYGGNVIPGTKTKASLQAYLNNIRKQIRYLRSCAPQASILFIGPSDMSTRENGQMATYPLVPVMDHLLAKLAEQEHIAYWSMFQAMGGEGSMIQWKEQGLAGNDYVHFTRSGANKVGKLLYEWINDKPTFKLVKDTKEEGATSEPIPLDNNLVAPTTTPDTAIVTYATIPPTKDTLKMECTKDTATIINHDTIPATIIDSTIIPQIVTADTTTMTILLPQIVSDSIKVISPQDSTNIIKNDSIQE
jgi:lysophospholipase L1-like esterase